MTSRNIVYVCDGTLSSIRAGEETNAGQLYRFLSRLGPDPRQIVRYDPGVQGAGWRKWLNAASGHGVNRNDDGSVDPPFLREDFKADFIGDQWIVRSVA